MRKLQIALFALLIIITGCKKEEIITITKSTGGVIERSTNAPLQGIKVAVSNGQRDLVTTTTDADGRFEFTVDFDKVTANDSLLFDGRPSLPTKKYELKGMGKAEYEYGTLWLYDKNDDMYLPQVTTDSIVGVDTTSVVVSGKVSSDGGFTVTKRGVCYATHQMPGFFDNVKPSGTGTGVFICEIGNLAPATDYYFRAFAINAIDTVFGEQKSVKTLAKTYSISISATPSAGGEVTGGGIFEEGSMQTVIATANNGYTFINWTENGNEVSTNASYSFTLNSNRNLVAHFQVETYTVTTSSNPANGGSTTGGGTYNHGQTCTMRATPADDYTFLRWTKNGTQVSTEPNYTFNVTESGNYVANFTNQPQTFMISVSANPSNGGTATGGGTYEMGQTCTVRATANSGYVFTNWTENGDVVSEETNCFFPVTGDRSLKANFTVSQNTYTVSISANPTSGGIVEGGGSFTQGQSCTVTATSNTGFVFVRWTENGNQVSDNPSYTFIVTGNRTLEAQFQMLSYTVSTSSNPTNGGVTSGGGNYQHGQQCTVTATANAGFSFTNWTENGNVVSSDASYSFSVTSNRTLVANFAPQTYIITVSANPSNGGGVSGGGTYSYGQSCTVTATAASGFNFVNWTENGNEVSSNESYVFNVDGNRNLLANFMATSSEQMFMVNGVSFTMKRVEGGAFLMGAQSTDPNEQNYDSEASNNESPVHSVTLTTFYMGETEVTQELWQAVVGNNPSFFSGMTHPVEQVCWNDIVNNFIPTLNALTGYNFRLPTEAEWEYAARGGNQGHGYKYAGSNNISDVAWFSGNSGSNGNAQTHIVKTKMPNELGLYDMSGNVEEWCLDWMEEYNSGSQTNPQGPSNGTSRVYRGGCSYSPAWNCRVSCRAGSAPSHNWAFRGFRLVLSY